MDIYLFIVILLFLVATLDLVVGVSNDAVNFLNSAIGSKVASIKTILIIATVGILLGSIFSGGIMEVARKGIFNPQHFTFDIIMYLFLAVMLTDIILLDFFNTLGMPTSTTVSIVFELLGAAVMAGLLMTINNAEPLNEFNKYINWSNASKIISGIFLSVLFAFSLGAIIQFFARWVMSFDFERNLKRYGAIFGGIAITAIAYFLLIKGLKGSPFADSGLYVWTLDHTWESIGILFLFFTLVLFILQRVASSNPLKLVVLAGTFSLAMAFAGNDLVNFIGVPLGAYFAYNDFLQTGLEASQFTMESLAEKKEAPLLILIFAGVVMSITLWVSSKARKVTETEVNLGRQDEGEERFRPNFVARSIVQSGIFLSTVFQAIIPKNMQTSLQKNFSKKAFSAEIREEDQPAFDLVRASINLMMASIIIAYATSKKMPLSTTYVSFMVAMGTSLADRAWGRESAVYRVAGVLSVIGGWFLTALIAFSCAALMAFIMITFKIWGILVVLALAVFALVRSHLLFKNRTELDDDDDALSTEEVEDLLGQSINLTTKLLEGINKAYSLSLNALPKESIEMLKLADKKMEKQLKKSNKVRVSAIRNTRGLETENLQVGRLYIIASDLLQDIAQSTKNITTETLFYVKNLHQTPNEEFTQLIQKTEHDVSEFISMVNDRIQRLDFSDSDDVVEYRKQFRDRINLLIEKQVEGIQMKNMNTKSAILQTELLLQSRDILAVTLRIYKLYRDFVDIQESRY